MGDRQGQGRVRVGKSDALAEGVDERRIEIEWHAASCTDLIESLADRRAPNVDRDRQVERWRRRRYRAHERYRQTRRLSGGGDAECALLYQTV
jgi:hypothetical protein